MEWIQGPLELPHGFTTRKGGVSRGPYASLNLSASTGDLPLNVRLNQERVLSRFGFPPVAALDQIHSATVHVVRGAGVWQGDGLLTDRPGLLLRVAVADCYPILLYDPSGGVVGALHAGWRGVLKGILPRALELISEHWKSPLGEVWVVVGPGISGKVYQVGPEVAERFLAQGLPVLENPYRLDLLAALRLQALSHGVRAEHFWASGHCTYSDRRFFSHRRDGGRTGRMWGVILRPRDL